MRFRDIIIHQLSLMLLTTLFVACSSDMDFPASEEMGRLQLAIPNVSAATRAVPADLDIPKPENFALCITNSIGRIVYNGKFTEEEISLPIGKYTIKATYGNDIQLGIDSPYYIAEATTTLVKDETSKVQLTATVGNALVSAIFGDTEENAARFDRFYSDYALYVGVGNFSIPISHSEASKSVYVRAGSNVTLRFWGKLKMENDREVQMTLESPDFPSPIKARDHAIVTLSLPDPESAMNVAISKVEHEEQTLDETIPLSWLPVAMVIPMHQYDRKGTLVGTNLIITESYPGKKWRAVITNAAGTTVRAVEGTGALQSEYSADANKDTWPYLPQGNYKANYYLFDDNDTPQFTIGAPNIQVNVSGYTSYDKYLQGDIDGANACNGRAIYKPSVTLNVSPTLLNNPNCNKNYSFSYTFDGTQTNVTPGANIWTEDSKPGLTPRVDAYTLQANATFDGVSATKQQEFIITGLPYSLDFDNQDEWAISSGVDWSGSQIKLGGGSTGSQSITNSTSICLPMGTYFCADYNVNVHNGVAGTTLSITCGSQELISIHEDGRAFGNDDHYHSGTSNVVHDNNQYITTIVCQNSYGASLTCSYIYSLSFKYANH